MSSAFLKLNSGDFIKGLAVFVLAAVFTWLAQVMNMPGFDFATFNWGELFRVAFAAMAAYLGKNILTDESGKMLGMIK